MWSFFTDIGKIIVKIVLIGFIIGALFALGYGISVIVPFEYLGYFFSIVKNLLHIFDFMLDIDTLITLIGWSFGISLLWLVFKGTAFIIKFFNEK